MPRVSAALYGGDRAAKEHFDGDLGRQRGESMTPLHRYLPTAAALLAALAPIVPAPAAGNDDVEESSSCYLLNTFNCVSWTTSAGSIAGCGWNGNSRTGCAPFTATLSGWSWLTPGSASASLAGSCTSSDSESWLEGSWGPVTAACTGQVGIDPLTCGRATAQATGTIVSATTSPGYSTSLRSSEGCNPLKVQVFQHISYTVPCRYFSGYAADLRAYDWGWDGCGNIRSDEDVDNDISSIKRRSGCTVGVWTEPNQGGTRYRDFTADTAYVGDDWNDVISSLWPTCPASPPDI